ncbi:LysR family transcriptional regulator [Aeromicrobium sp.]|uniref:LysR family transcriptional regulator n=1 Tax=Aeromicrobium sp. TaxID=1871063 RepID=UPI0028AB0D45|nr:LysR family transcriptional regulator [Aeromicrobium sp.]
MLNPVHLATLVTVIRTGSFADAARELGYTGSAVSQQIAALERATRVTLFDRSARSVTATPAAELLAARSREALALLRDLEDDVAAMASGQLGTLRVGSFPTASEALLPVAFRHFREIQPRVKVRLEEAESDQLIGQLLDGQIDVTLMHQYDLVPRATPKGLIRVPLIDEDLLLLVPESHPLVGLGYASWRKLESETWITTGHGTAGAACLRRLSARAGFEPQIAFRSNDYDVIREFVRSGLGVALVPALCGGASPGTVAISSDHGEVRRRVSLLHRGETLNPVVSGFLDALHRAVRDVSSEYMRPPGASAGQ